MEQWIKLVVRAILLFVTIGLVVQYTKSWRAQQTAFTIEGPACMAAPVSPE